MNKIIGNSWDEYLKNEFDKPYFKYLETFVDKEYQTKTVYPKEEDIFNAFRYTDFKNIKAVILGQDPYHNEGEAMGLSFSVPKGVKIPPSLDNIYKEMIDDIGIEKPKTGDLIPIAKEGVFLLNTTLTVLKNQPLSHYGFGWEEFTDNVIRMINRKNEPVVFILFGSNARKKKQLITNPKHLIIETVHPSPLSCYNGFFGSKPFSRCNTFLMDNEILPIDWSKLNEN